MLQYATTCHNDMKRKCHGNLEAFQSIQKASRKSTNGLTVM